ncbi:MAG: UvrD-helicase domain-containing protein [Chloroflexi bacterium]|nr:UvrD-helicase domain-containing protein [Chloroflexota bacterium]
MTERIPADRAQRDLISQALDRTLIVEAGAGTGKTQSFVSRIENLLLRGGVTIDRIVAITFTRAAAAELRERIRGRLEELARDGGLSDEDALKIGAALDGIDHAAIQTIHSFAESLVRERAVDAGLPLIIEPMDDVDAALEFDERWGTWLREKLEDEEFAAAFGRAARFGLSNPLGQLRDIALAFHGEYDRIRDVAFAVTTNEIRVAAKSLVASAPALEEQLAWSIDGEGDPLYEHTRRVIALARSLDGIDLTSDEALGILARAPKIGTNRGNKNNWEMNQDGENAATALKGMLGDIQQLLDAELTQAREAALAPLLKAIQKFVLDYAKARRGSGRAEFQDLLVWAYDLLSGSERARAHFAGRYTHVLIDEFQDTDPLQIEIALLLVNATEEGRSGMAKPGALFAVGDPKQSIYRFRRADVSAMARLPERVQGERVQIFETFRSHTGIVDWVNHLFGDWMGSDDTPGQARYVALQTAREPRGSDNPQGVYFIGDVFDEGSIGDVRTAEAGRIARAALSIGGGRWTVNDKDAPDGARPSKFSDLCILFPRRAGLPQLERALQDAGVPYTLEGQSQVLNSQEIRDILAALGAIDDPTDQIALVAALRSPLFGCSDVDLFRWADAGGAFDYLEPEIEGQESGPIAESLSVLRDLHDIRMQTPTPELIERLVEGQYLRHLSYGSRLGRERRRQIGVLLESARILGEAGRPSLRAFVRWAGERAAAGDGFSEGAAADIDYNAVRLMTVHHAKGLEFPIVLMTGLNSSGRGGGGSPLLVSRTKPGQVAVRIGSGGSRFEYGDYESLSELEKDADLLERVRVMYVGATRAKDYLVVSLFRTARDKKSPASQIAERMEGKPQLWGELPEFGEIAIEEEPVPRETWGSETEFAAWIERRERLLAAGRKPAGVSATALKEASGEIDESKPASPDAEARPWQKGRGGTEVGRAVHAVLQDVDLETGEGIDELAARHAGAEGITQRVEEVASLASATLDAGVMRRAAAAKTVLREAYVAVPVSEGGRTTLEGFVDLIFEDENGDLVVVDYKTDQVGESGSLASAAEPYEVQLGAYVYAIEQSTGRRVSEAWLVFSRRALAGREAGYRLPDLDAARRKALERARDAVGV